MVPDYSMANSVFTTIQCKLHVTNRLGKQQKKWRQCNFWYLLEQCSSTISSSAVRMRSALSVENFHAMITFATQTTSNFTKDIAKSFSIDVNHVWQAKCPTRRRKWRLFTFAKFISRCTLNLAFLNALPYNRVLICRWDRVSTSTLSRLWRH